MSLLMTYFITGEGGNRSAVFTHGSNDEFYHSSIVGEVKPETGDTYFTVETCNPEMSNFSEPGLYIF